MSMDIKPLSTQLSGPIKRAAIKRLRPSGCANGAQLHDTNQGYAAKCYASVTHGGFRRRHARGSSLAWACWRMGRALDPRCGEDDGEWGGFTAESAEGAEFFVWVPGGLGNFWHMKSIVFDGNREAHQTF